MFKYSNIQVKVKGQNKGFDSLRNYVVHGKDGVDRVWGTGCCRLLLSDSHTVILNFLNGAMVEGHSFLRGTHCNCKAVTWMATYCNVKFCSFL